MKPNPEYLAWGCLWVLFWGSLALLFVVVVRSQS